VPRYRGAAVLGFHDAEVRDVAVSSCNGAELPRGNGITVPRCAGPESGAFHAGVSLVFCDRVGVVLRYWGTLFVEGRKTNSRRTVKSGQG